MITFTGPRDVTAERLREVLAYDADTGVFMWRVKRGNRAAGQSAGVIAKGGYRLIRVDGRMYRAHRLAWLYVHGVWPVEIDHRHGVAAGDGIANLRDTTHRGNARNQKFNARNTSGFRGVHCDKRGNKSRPWQAMLKFDGKNRYLGSFETPEQASAAYLAARAIHYPEQPIPRDERI